MDTLGKADQGPQDSTSTPGDGYVLQSGDIVVSWRVSLTGSPGLVDLVRSVQDSMLDAIEGNRSLNGRGFSNVLSRMDKLLGFGHMP